MNDKKNNFLRVQVDTITEQAFKKIVENKGITIQEAIEGMLKNFIFENLNCIMNNNDRK